MIKYILILLLFSTLNVDGQSTFNVSFVENPNYNDNNGKSIAEANNGDIYALSITYTPKGDIRLVKLNSQGETQWDTTYTFTPSEEFFPKMISAVDGGVIVASTSYSYPFPDQDGIQDILVWKIDKNGAIVWQQVLEARDFKDLVQTKDGNYVLLGTIYENGLDFLVYKIDPLGNIIWKNTYGIEKDEKGSVWERPIDIEELNGYLYLFGHRNRSGELGSDGLMYKIDSNGNLIWELLRKRSDLNSFPFINQVFSLNDKYYFYSKGIHEFNAKTGNYQSLSESVPWNKVVVKKGCNNNDEIASAISYENGQYHLHKYFIIDSIHSITTIPSMFGTRKDAIETKDGGYLILTTTGKSIQIIKTDCMGNEFWSDECNSKIVEGSNILLYPNPATGRLSIEATFDFNEVELNDMKGCKVLIENTCECNEQNIDVSFLSAGVYIITIKGKTRQHTSKFIKY